MGPRPPQSVQSDVQSKRQHRRGSTPAPSPSASAPSPSTASTPTTPNSNAVFRLNGKRTKIYTAISWGYWGLNGMFPVPELAEKEVRSAQALGLNCLNFHRNLAKEDVLRWHDRLGVLRYMEPGAGKMAIGKLPARTDASANSVVMQQARQRSGQVRAALHVHQVRRDGESLPLAPLRHRVLPAERARRRPQEPRHARHPQSHARRRPLTLRRPQRRLRRAWRRTSLVRTLG